MSDLLSVTESVSLSSPEPSASPIGHLTHRYHFRSNCLKLRITTFVILQNAFEIIATTFTSHGTCRNLKWRGKKTEMTNREVKTQFYLLTHSRLPSILIYITPSTMRPRDLVWCFPHVLMAFSAVIMGITTMTEQAACDRVPD